MLGEKGIELIKELERNPERIPPFNEDVVRQVVDETKALFDQNQLDVQETVRGVEGLWPSVHTRHAAIERNKRCLVAYTKERLDRLKHLRWDHGSVIPPEIKSNLSEKENDFFQGYSSALAQYMRSLGDHGGVDLTNDRQPPKSLYLQVKCVSDYGDFETSDGTTVLLKKNTMHSLPRSDCEPLIRQGILEHVLS